MTAPSPYPEYNPGPGPGSSQDVSPDTQRIIAIISHIGGVFLSWLVPLVTFLIFPADRTPWLNQHTKEALNFQIALFVGYIISAILSVILIGFVLGFLLWVYAIIASIQASLAASRGEEYRYPWSIRLIK